MSNSPSQDTNTAPAPDGRTAFDLGLSGADAFAFAVALVGVVDAIIVALDGEGRIVEFNPGAERITGYRREEMAGRNWFEVICPPDLYPEVWEEFRRLGGGGMPRTFENPIRTKSGDERLVVWSNSEWRSEDGALCTVSVGIDVTEQRQSNRALAETLALLGSIVEGAPSAIFAKDLEGRYTLMNTLGAEFLETPKDEIVGKTDRELFPSKLAEEFVEGDRHVIETGKPFSYTEEDIPDENGAWQYRLVTKGPVLDERGELAGVFGITSDLTESLFSEKAIAQAARENEQLARAAMALIECESEDDVFNVVVDFFAEVVPDAFVVVNQSTDGGRYFQTRHVTGANHSVLMKAAKLVGFDIVGNRFPVTEEYRRDFFSTSLTEVPGGFSALAAGEIPRPVMSALESALSLRDAYTIGIRSDCSEYGCIHVLTRTPNAVLPARIIDAFVRQCVLALSAIERANEVAEYQERLEALLAERVLHAENLAVALTSVIDVVSRTVEMRDPFTAGHQRRVAVLAEAIGREHGMSESEIEDVRIAALMHDVGKVSVPAEILSKPGKLTAPEFALAQYHAQAGHEIVQAAHMREPIAEMIYQHHERCDGSGYPRGLRAEDLTPGTKVIMVADVVEAMASHRPYRPAIGIEQALEEIERGAGTLYDPEIVAACVSVIKGGFEFEAEPSDFWPIDTSQ